MSAKNELVKKIDYYLHWLEIIVFHSGWSRHALLMISEYIDERNRKFEEAIDRMDWNNPDAKQYGETEIGLTRLAFCTCQLYIYDVTSVLVKILDKLKELSPELLSKLNVEGQSIPVNQEEMRKRDVVRLDNCKVYRVDEIFQLANYAKHRAEWPDNISKDNSQASLKKKPHDKTLNKVRDFVIDEYWGERIQQSWTRFDINQPSEIVKLFDIIDEWGKALYKDTSTIWHGIRRSCLDV